MLSASESRSAELDRRRTKPRVDEDGVHGGVPGRLQVRARRHAGPRLQQHAQEAVHERGRLASQSVLQDPSAALLGRQQQASHRALLARRVHRRERRRLARIRAERVAQDHDDEEAVVDRVRGAVQCEVARARVRGHSESRTASHSAGGARVPTCFYRPASHGGVVGGSGAGFQVGCWVEDVAWAREWGEFPDEVRWQSWAGVCCCATARGDPCARLVFLLRWLHWLRPHQPPHVICSFLILLLPLSQNILWHLLALRLQSVIVIRTSPAILHRSYS